MYYKRTLILNDINNHNSTKKGIITLENVGGGIKGQLRLYNFRDYPNNAALGIASGSEIVKVPLALTDNIVDFELKKELNLQEKLSCGLVDITELSCPQIVIGGTSNYLNDWADRVEQAFAYDAKVLEREEMYENNVEEIENEISTVLRQDKEYHDCSMCSKCKYKEAFFKNAENQADEQTENQPKEQIEEKKEPTNLDKINELLATATALKIESETLEQEPQLEYEDNIEENLSREEDIEKKDNEPLAPEEDIAPDFYDQIKEQIDDLFKNHSREENLEALIPGSKWVKVEYQDIEGHYVMGLIYDGEKLRFISYGLPAQNKLNPPSDLVEYAQWLSVGTAEQGYWLVYQDANSGESVKVE